MKTTLSAEAVNAATRGLAEANRAFAARYPGETGARQPVHTFYGGAHLFRAGTAAKLGALAIGSLEQYAPDPATLAQALAIHPALAGRIYAPVREKLRSEAVEDH